MDGSLPTESSRCVIVSRHSGMTTSTRGQCMTRRVDNCGKLPRDKGIAVGRAGQHSGPFIFISCSCGASMAAFSVSCVKGGRIPHQKLAERTLSKARWFTSSRIVSTLAVRSTHIERGAARLRCTIREMWSTWVTSPFRTLGIFDHNGAKVMATRYQCLHTRQMLVHEYWPGFGVVVSWR